MRLFVKLLVAVTLVSVISAFFFQSKEFHARLPLSNGVTIYSEASDKLPLMQITAKVSRAGIVYEDFQGPEGVSQVVANTLKFGTKSQSAIELADQMAALASSLKVEVDAQSAQFTLKVLSTDIEPAVELLYQLLTEATFPSEEVEKYKKRTLVQMKGDLATSHNSVVSYAMQRHYYGKHPRARVGLNPQSIANISSDLLKSFYKTHYRPEHVSLIFSGKGFKKEYINRFRDWQPRSGEALARKELAYKPQHRQLIFIENETLKQSYIKYQYQGVSYCDPSRLVLNVNNFLFGGGTIFSYLGQEARVKRGLTYGIYSQVKRYRDGGVFSISTSTKPQSLIEMLNLIQERLDSFASNENNSLNSESLEQARASVSSILTTLGASVHARALTRYEGREMGCEGYFDRLSSRLSKLDLNKLKSELSFFSSKKEATLVVYGLRAQSTELMKWAKENRFQFKKIDIGSLFK